MIFNFYKDFFKQANLLTDLNEIDYLELNNLSRTINQQLNILSAQISSPILDFLIKRNVFIIKKVFFKKIQINIIELIDRKLNLIQQLFILVYTRYHVKTLTRKKPLIKKIFTSEQTKRIFKSALIELYIFL